MKALSTRKKKWIVALAVPVALAICGGIYALMPGTEILPSVVPSAAPTNTPAAIAPSLSPCQTKTAANTTIPVPSAPGGAVMENNKAVIDYSNTAEGYVMVKYQGDTDKELRTLIDAPNGVRYTYTLQPGSYAVYPLTEGNGEYTIGVYEQTEGTKYKVAVKTPVNVSLTDPFMPFLTPSQYVNYDKDSAVVKKAAELTAGAEGLLDKITAVYNFSVSHITYDDALAKTVQSGYLPDVDAVLKRQKGICFDYAAVMAAMLRSQCIPTKLVVGYTGAEYHAWLNVYSEETGWINQAVFFDGSSWKLMDPTLAAGSVDYKANEIDYEAKYQY